MKFIIVSGLSGAGKSTVMSILEDSGFFCVDNLPPVLIPKFAEVCLAGAGAYERVAMVCDIRGGHTFDGLFEALDTLTGMKFEYEILFVEADNETIIKRYKETRRAHPLMDEEQSLVDAVEKERAMMAPVRERAAYIIKTNTMSTKKLRSEVLSLLAPERENRRDMSISVTSFGFKYGIPMEADLVFDVRFLPNPFYVDELRSKTGLDAPVRDYIFNHREAVEFMDRLRDMIAFLLPQYVEEGKSALVIAIGCTGGHHRSVAVTRALAGAIGEMGYQVSENHRDMTRA